MRCGRGRPMQPARSRRIRTHAELRSKQRVMRPADNLSIPGGGALCAPITRDSRQPARRLPARSAHAAKNSAHLRWRSPAILLVDKWAAPLQPNARGIAMGNVCNKKRGQRIDATLGSMNRVRHYYDALIEACDPSARANHMS